LITMTELEWLNQNRHRNYPLADGVSATSADDRTLPTSFLVDLSLDIPPLSVFESGTFYISELTPLKEGFIVNICHKGDKNSSALTIFRSVPIRYDFAAPDTDIESHRIVLPVTEEALQEYPELEQANCRAIIGSCDGISNIIGATFSPEATRLHSLVIHKGYAGLSRVIVVDSDGVEHTVTGDLIMTTGRGIQLTATGNGVEISESPISLEEQEADSEYHTLDDVLSAIFEKLGIPITSINGLAPDTDGNFYITGLDCTDINAVGNGLTISNPCAKPCCPPDTSTDVATALKALEDAKNRLINYHEALLNNLQTMQSRLASLIAAKG